MEIAAISFVSIALGLLVGYEWGERRGRKARMAAFSALPDYDMNNPINQGQYARTVVEDGVTWTVYGGWNGQR